jgi:lipoate-protein ligase A
VVVEDAQVPLNAPAVARLDVEGVRALPTITVLLRTIDRPMIILGSSQSADLVLPGIEVVRRRGGGGAVLVEPTSTVWVDVWIPATSGLHSIDATSSLRRVGGLFREALVTLGVVGPEVVDLAAAPRQATACFDALGNGELVVDGSKLLGLAAWRSREGSLLQSAMYVDDAPDVWRHLVGSTPVDAVATTTLARVRGRSLDASSVASAVTEIVAASEPVQFLVAPPAIEAADR